MNHFNFSGYAKRSVFTAFVVSLVALFPTTVSLAQSAPTPAPMSLSEMSALIDSLLSMVRNLTAQIAELSIQQNATSAVNPAGSVVTSVPASILTGVGATIANGVITPASFTFSQSEAEQKSIFINAQDADYAFQIPESGINMIIREGTKMEITLGTLGVGTHVFSCGAVCTGTINIESEDDGDQPLN